MFSVGYRLAGERGTRQLLYVPRKKESYLNQRSVWVQKNKWAMREQMWHKVDKQKFSSQSYWAINGVAYLPMCENTSRGEEDGTHQGFS